MTLDQMQQDLSLQHIPDSFKDLYRQIASSWEDRAAVILSDTFIRESLVGGYAMLPFMDIILRAAAEVRQNKAMCLLICLLELHIRKEGTMAGLAYKAPVGDGLAWDFLHLFPAIPTIGESVAYLRRRNVPEDIIAATLQEYDFCINDCKGRLGRPAFDQGRLNWICIVIRNQLIHIGRFKYDLPKTYNLGVRVYRNEANELMILADNVKVHKSGRLLGCVGHTDTEGSFFAELTEDDYTVTGHPVHNARISPSTVSLSKAHWTVCLTSEDPVLRIHIPPDGSFDKQTIAETYARTRDIFAACYPDCPYKAFFCCSWLMSLDLHRILKPDSNILGFQEFFTPLPFMSSGSLVFPFVFSSNAAIPSDLGALPENTSLQRAVKKLYLEGGYIHEGAGFLF